MARKFITILFTLSFVAFVGGWIEQRLLLSVKQNSMQK
jgi:hypothetical protein